MRDQPSRRLVLLAALLLLVSAACSAFPGSPAAGTPASNTATPALAGSAGPQDVPLFEPHSNVTATSQVLNFNTTADITTVANFYAVEMPKLGWSNLSDPYIDDTVAKLAFTKSGKTADIGIAIDPKSNQTANGILVQ